MNQLNEAARILRCTIENIDRVLENEQISFKRAEEIIKRRNEYSEELKRLKNNLNGVDY